MSAKIYTVDDIYDSAVERIKAIREQYFREDVIRDHTDPDPTGYMCWRCRRRHWALSKIGQAHLPADRKEESNAQENNRHS